MKLLILGSGCPNCKKPEENTKKAVLELGLKASVGKVTDYAKMASYGVNNHGLKPVACRT